jgi:hypothetical protein
MPNQGMSPYQIGAENTQPPALPKKPSIIPKVMGLSHLILGGVSLVSAISSLLRGGTLSSTLERQVGDAEGAIFVSPSSLALLNGVDLANGWLLWLDLLVCIALIVAGVGLLKYRKWGRSISNVYVSGSLLVKAFNGYILLVLAKPFFEAFVAENEVLQPVGVAGLQAILGASVILGGFYAIATAIVVNLKSARQSLH